MKAVVLCLFWLMLSGVNAAYVVNNAGRKISGVSLSSTPEGVVTLVTGSGQKMSFNKSQYRSAFVARPSELMKAKKLLASGASEAGVILLKQLKQKYQFVQWDLEAAALLAAFYFEAKRFAEAAVEFKYCGDEVRWKLALIRSGATNELLPALQKELASGNRAVVAQAYLQRGQIWASQGDKARARRDWLIVVRFFKAQKEVAAQAEALLEE